MQWDENSHNASDHTSDSKNTGAVITVLVVIAIALLAAFVLVVRNGSTTKLPHPVDPTVMVVPTAQEVPASSPLN